MRVRSSDPAASSDPGLLVPLTRVLLGVVVALAAYEWLKQWLLPNLSPRDSSLVDIGCISIAAALVAFYLLRARQLLYSQMKLETLARERTEEDLQRARREAQAQIEERTHELEVANQVLLAEIRDCERAEVAQLKSEELFTTLARNLNGMVALFNHDLRYTLAEGQGPAVMGLAKEQLEGKKLGELYPAQVCQTLEPAFRAAFSGTCTRLEVPFAERYYEVNVVPLQNERAEISAGMAIVQDITERKRALENASRYENVQHSAALEERQRLARELHDSVSQALYGIQLGATTAHEMLTSDTDEQDLRSELAEPLDYVVSLADAGLAEMRALIFDLRPESLETEGLVVGLNKQIASLRARHGIAVEADLCQEPDITLELKETLYRIAQEALHNTVKHAQASQVDLRLGCDENAVVMEIRDNGKGFEANASYPGHLGLRSMRERAERLGGDLTVESAPDAGTRVTVRIPISTPQS